MRHGRRTPGYSVVFWAVFIALVLLPLLALAIEVGRYSYARAELTKAADAAALAAAIEVERSVFRETGEIVLTSSAWAQAQGYVNSNTSYLTMRGIHAVVADIEVDEAGQTVVVIVSASLDRLFPVVISGLTVSASGLARFNAVTCSE